MNIFEKRPLCLILCIGLCGFLLFTFENQILKIATITIAILLGILSLFLRKDKYKHIVAAFSAGAVLLGAIASFLYFDLYFKAYNLYEGEVEIVGTVEEVSESSSYSQRLLIQAESINGSPSTYRFYAYPTKAEASGIIEGTRISFKANLDGFSNESYTFNLSDGINAYASDLSEITILEYTDGTPRMIFARVREYLTRYTINLSDGQTGAILSALLLGERDYLPDQLQLDFRRIGISHILALSGMHLAILSLGLTKLLAFFGIGKRTAGIFNIFFTAAYMILTGFPVSVVRAGIMLIILNLLFVTVGSHDSLTSLSVAVFLICLFDPTSIFDISLWLSAFATLGILVYSEYLSQSINRRKKPERERRPLYLKILFGALNWLKLSLFASVFAISATLLISTSTFGEISVLSLISTAILSPLIEVIMYLGTLTLIVGGIIPIGKLLFPFTRAVGWISGALSSLDNVYVSASGIITVILSLATSILLVIFFVFKIQRKRVFIAIIAISLCATYSSAIIANLSARNTEDIIYVNGEDRSTFVIKSSGEVGVICSASYNQDATAEVTSTLTAQKLSELDYYFATHYGFGLISHLNDILSTCKVDVLVLPNPRNEDEKTIFKRVENVCKQYGTDISHFVSKTPFLCGDVGITLNHSTVYGTDTIRTAFTLTNSGVIYTYLSSGMLMEDNINFSKRITRNTDVLILGSHGKSYGADFGNIDESFENVRSFILCTEGLYFTQDAYEYYVRKGCKIYTHPDAVSIVLNK